MTYKEIISSKNRINKNVKIRAIVGICILVLFLSFVSISGSLLKGISKLSNILPSSCSFQDEKGEPLEWLETGLSVKLPKLNSYMGQIETNTDTELWIRLENVTYNDFENYVTACKQSGYTIEAKKDTRGYEAYNLEGFFLDIYLWDSTKGSLDIKLKAPLIGDESFTWPEHKLAGIIPKIEEKLGAAEVDKDDSITIYIYNMSKEEYSLYISRCEELFNIDSKKEIAFYEGYDSQGNKINVRLGDMKDMTITVDSPRKLSKISWPSSGLATLLPKPSFEVGEISIDFDWSFSIYIGSLSIDEFNSYIEKCIEKGFKKESRSERSFSAKKGEEIDLKIEYVGYNIVYISITNFDEF